MITEYVLKNLSYVNSRISIPSVIYLRRQKHIIRKPAPTAWKHDSHLRDLGRWAGFVLKPNGISYNTSNRTLALLGYTARYRFGSHSSQLRTSNATGYRVPFFEQVLRNLRSLTRTSFTDYYQYLILVECLKSTKHQAEEMNMVPFAKRLPGNPILTSRNSFFFL